jgi:threonylcarbamoyladenosine tRNA methylthiotransferase MtaB
MGRPYDSTLVLGLMERILSLSPDACVGMDIMVGFPGEDERSFERTRGLVVQLNPAYLHVFPFSPRPGTPAASFRPLVPDNEAKRRVEGLRSLSAVLRRQFYERFIGRILEVVPEERSEATDGVVTVRSDNYIPVKVALAADAYGKQQFKVMIESMEGEDVWGVYAAGT